MCIFEGGFFHKLALAVIFIETSSFLAKSLKIKTFKSSMKFVYLIYGSIEN
jgi:hypothetical protein